MLGVLDEVSCSIGIILAGSNDRAMPHNYHAASPRIPYARAAVPSRETQWTGLTRKRYPPDLESPIRSSVGIHAPRLALSFPRTRRPE